MANPTTIEEIQALGTIVCPKCQKILDATDLDGLYNHVVNVHPEEARQVAFDVTMDTLCETGILRKT